MKKIFLSLFMTMFVLAAAFSNTDSFFTTEVSLGSGVSIYDSNTGDLRKEIIAGNDYKRIILGLTADTNLNISKSLKILLGADLFTDFLWTADQHYNTLDYAFYTGIKFFPNLSGLNFSIAYALGNRTDFSTDARETKDWGNGFRIAIQYDFMEKKNVTIKPIVGAYYRNLPRGNYNKDNILCLYGGIRF